jgi:hypothetical protein
MMKRSIYAGMMAFLAVTMAFVFTAGVAMAASEDQNVQPRTNSSTQENMNNESTMHSQPQTGISENTQRGAAGQNQTRTPGQVKTNVSGSDVNAQRNLDTQQNLSSQTDVSTHRDVPAQRDMNAQHDVGAQRNVPGQRDMNAQRDVGAQPNMATQPAPAAETQPGMRQPATAVQNPGTPAVVARVDRPDNCLRIRSGPARSGNIIGCAKMGEQLFLTGVFSDDGRWAQLSNNGWVYVDQIQSSLKPKKHARAVSRPRASDDYDMWEEPAGTYYEDYPSYGYYGDNPGFYGGYRSYGYRRFGAPYGYGYGPGIGFGFRIR